MKLVVAKTKNKFLPWVETDKVSELLQKRDLIRYKLVEFHLREAVAEHWKNFHKDKPSANQDIMAIRTLETSLVRQFTEHQLQIASDLDFIKLQLAELVNHLKKIGDAKNR
ncbi:hypothetical protein F511_29600 [Dorcoceras hygrometricum]|uniref:Uncharacterized protein n=1 Tax=Dorcoceras hygrometricum TaxID=472368 RepID=A0A2Z7B1G9_9LAMI|nr:hypothetical protein F511_29600 [Dorcoceras hygrometricum]